MSIGTLLAYSTVCVCVLVLRYKPADHVEENETNTVESVSTTRYTAFKILFTPDNKKPTRTTSKLVNWLTCECIICIIGICFILTRTMLSHWYMILLLTVLTVILVISMVIIWCQPQISNITTFKVNFEFFEILLFMIN